MGLCPYASDSVHKLLVIEDSIHMVETGAGATMKYDDADANAPVTRNAEVVDLTFETFSRFDGVTRIEDTIATLQWRHQL